MIIINTGLINRWPIVDTVQYFEKLAWCQIEIFDILVIVFVLLSDFI